MEVFYVFHLNDINLQIKDYKKIVGSSPGISCIAKNKIITGIDAMPYLSKKPTIVNSNYWHNIEKKNSEFTSTPQPANSDLVYKQLQIMWSKLGNNKPVLIGYPSEYTEEQLGIICGIFESLNIKVKGLINTDLCSLSDLNINDKTHLIRLQMNHITHIELDSSNALSIKSLKYKENHGLIQLYNKLAQLFRKIFIRQSRADPMINGESEHYLRTQIPRWIRVTNDTDVCKINTLINGNLYSAELKSSLVQSIIEKFFEEVLFWVGSSRTNLVLCPTTYHLTKDFIRFSNVSLLPEPRIAKFFSSTVFKSREGLIVNLKENFPKKNKEIKSEMQQINDLAPTHILKDNKGFRISEIPLQFAQKRSKISISKKNKKTVLNPHGNFVFINETLKNSEVEILIGDKIKFPSSSTYFEAKKIEN